MASPDRMPAISAVNYLRRIAVTDDWRQLPITDMYDEDGEPTDVPEKVRYIIVEIADDCWARFDVKGFEPRKAH